MLALLALALAPALAGCGGPLPPDDPFYLRSAKDDLSRGNHWYLRGCGREASRFYSEALASARLSDSVPHIVMALNAMGAVRLSEGRNGEAAALLEEAAELSRADPGNPGLPAVLGNLGTLAYRSGRREDALAFWEDAAVRARARGESPAQHLASLARAHLDSGGAEAPAFREALSRARAALDSPGTPPAARADVLNLSAREAHARGDASAARADLDQALAIDRKEENQSGLAEDLELAGAVLSASGDQAGAASALERAFYLRAALGDRDGAKRALAALRAGHKAHGLPKGMEAVEAVAKDPKLFDPLAERCP
jgi:tetratricopeptide (TPR) repeat protein